MSDRFLAAAKSNYVGTLARVASQLVAQVAIMRLLGPDLVGTFGYVLLLNGVLALVVDQGFGWSLIQGNFSDDEIAVAFTRLMLAGGVCAVVVFLCSFPIALWLANPLVGEVIRWSAPAYLLIGLYAVSHARLRRDLRFRELQYATNGAYVIAYPGVGLAMALSGFGVWSLLVAWYTQGVLQALIGHRYASHAFRVTAPWRTSQAGPLGRQVAGINVLNWAVDNSGAVVVGSMGAQALGSYNAASVLARQPALQLVQTLQGLLFSTASAIQDNDAKIKKLYLTSLAVVSLAVGPLYGYFFAHADWLVSLVFGQKWASAGGVLSALSLGMTAMALSTVTSSILTANGGQTAVVQTQAICLLVMVVGLAWAMDQSVEAVAWVVSLAYLLRFCGQVTSVVRTGAVGWGEIWLALRGALLLTMLAAIPLTQWLSTGVSPWVAEVLTLFSLLLVSLLALRLQPRLFIPPVLVDVLVRVAAGRKLLRSLGLGVSHD